VNPSRLARWSRARLAGRTLGTPGPILSVPVVPQSTDFSCGAAALLACLKYWLGPDGLPSNEDALWALLGTNPVEGTMPEPIAGVARALGLSAEVRDGMTTRDVPGLLADGVTAILAVQAWGEDPETYDKTDQDGHWVVLVGADEEQVRLMDPSAPDGYTHMDLSDLARRWHDLDAGRPRPGLAVLIKSGGIDTPAGSATTTPIP
jgi:predicted double-glycine peptidase